MVKNVSLDEKKGSHRRLGWRPAVDAFGMETCGIRWESPKPLRNTFSIIMSLEKVFPASSPHPAKSLSVYIGTQLELSNYMGLFLQKPTSLATSVKMLTKNGSSGLVKVGGGEN